MSRTINSGKHYGVRLEARLSESMGCCGVGMLHGFKVQHDSGAADKLTVRQKNKLYKALMRNVLDFVGDQGWGIIIATDAVDGWSGGNAGGGRPVNDMCMADFCRYFNFKESEMGDNGNSGNGVATFTLVPFPRNGEEMVVEMPRFPAPPKPARRRRGTANISGDRAALIQSLREALNS